MTYALKQKPPKLCQECNIVDINNRRSNAKFCKPCQRERQRKNSIIKSREYKLRHKKANI